jgi:hypothetical protein
MSASIPLVFFDNRKELDVNFLRILRRIEVDATIVILVSHSNHSPPVANSRVLIIDVHTLPEYIEKEREFLLKYRHYSTNSYEFETSCFLRFLALECLAKDLKLKRFWLLDCDVWPTKSLELYNDSKNDYFSPDYFDEMTISSHSSLLSSKVLSEFNQFLINEFYSNMRDDLEKKYEALMSTGSRGGISDMLAMGMFLKQRTDFQWLNSNTDGISGHFLNHTISRIHLDLGKHDRNWLMILRTRDYFLVISRNSFRKYATLHFQGNDKHLIPILDKLRIIWGNQRIYSLLVRISRRYQKTLLLK